MIKRPLLICDLGCINH